MWIFLDRTFYKMAENTLLWGLIMSALVTPVVGRVICSLYVEGWGYHDVTVWGNAYNKTSVFRANTVAPTTPTSKGICLATVEPANCALTLIGCYNVILDAESSQALVSAIEAIEAGQVIMLSSGDDYTISLQAVAINKLREIDSRLRLLYRGSFAVICRVEAGGSYSLVASVNLDAYTGPSVVSAEISESGIGQFEVLMPNNRCTNDSITGDLRAVLSKTECAWLCEQEECYAFQIETSPNAVNGLQQCALFCDSLQIDDCVHDTAFILYKRLTVYTYRQT